jgi:hypothetical protein
LLVFEDLAVLGRMWMFLLFGDCICLPPNALLYFLSPNEQINQDRNRNPNSEISILVNPNKYNLILRGLQVKIRSA